MVVVLDGGCRVTAMKEGEPSPDGASRVWIHFDRSSGARAISLRVSELAAGESATLQDAASDDVLYAVSGTGRAVLDGVDHALAADHGIYLPAGSTLLLQAHETLTLIGSRCPADVAASSPPAVVAMEERPVERTG